MIDQQIMPNYFSKTILFLFPILLIAACADSKPPSPEEQAFALLGVLKNAVEQKDKESVMALLAPTFHHPEVGARNDAYAMMTLMLESGFEGVLVLETNLTRYLKEKAATQARLSPITLKGQQNAIEFELLLIPSTQGEGWQIQTFNLSPHAPAPVS